MRSQYDIPQLAGHDTADPEPDVRPDQGRSGQH